METRIRCGRWCQALLAAAAILFIAGCSTTEPDNMSERPWNTPKSWENGLPAGMMEGR